MCVFFQIDANRAVDEVFADVRALFGALPPKEVQKVKRKKKKVAAKEEEEKEEWVEFSGQRIVFVLGKGMKRNGKFQRPVVAVYGARRFQRLGKSSSDSLGFFSNARAIYTLRHVSISDKLTFVAWLHGFPAETVSMLSFSHRFLSASQ